MTKPQFLLTIFITLVAFITVRLFCLKYCLQARWYQTILNDNLHHYQLGLALIPIAVFVLRKFRRLRSIILAIATGMIIDESTYLLYPLNKNFAHNTLAGVAVELVVFLALSLVWSKKQPTRNPPTLK